MRARQYGGLMCLALVLGGCAEFYDSREPFPFRNPFADRHPDVSNAPVASAKVATRVHAVGQSVIAANRADLPTKPVFMTVGIPEPMLFHRRSGDVIISEGLVERCATDAELAAVISHELGKVAAAQADRGPPPTELDLPPAPPPSHDVVGNGQTADLTRLAEEARYDRRRASRGDGRARAPKADPKELARTFLTRTGHDAEELRRLEALLTEAEENADNRDILKGR